MSVSVVFPEELLVASKEDREKFTRQVMVYTLGHLYEQGKISSGLGAKVLGCDRWEFYRLLSENGFAVIDYLQVDEKLGNWDHVLAVGAIHAWVDPEVTLSFRYNLTQAANYEADEFSQALLSLDGALIGVAPNDYIVEIVGDGNSEELPGAHNASSATEIASVGESSK